MTLSPSCETALAPLQQMLIILWAAMTGGKAAYLGIVYILSQSGSGPLLILPDIVRWVLTASGALLAVVSILLWQSWASAQGIQKAMSALSPQDLHPQITAANDDESAKTAQPDGYAAFSNGEKRLFHAMLGLRGRMILCLALNDVLAALGLIAGLLGRSPERAAPLIVAAMLANLFVFPRLNGAIRDLPEPPSGPTIL